MSNSAKFMLVGILVVVLLIAMIWDRSNEQPGENGMAETYPLASTVKAEPEQTNGLDMSQEIREPAVAEGEVGTGPGVQFSDGETAETDEEIWGNEQAETAEETEEAAPEREEEQAPANPEPTMEPEKRFYVTTEGDTYWSIAEKFYGTGVKHEFIHKANMDVCPEPTLMRPGMKLVIPEPQAPAAPAPVERPAPSADTNEYVVKAGDTLWTIAEKIYNKPMRYKEIYRLNTDRLDSEDDMLKIGMKLRMP